MTPAADVVIGQLEKPPAGVNKGVRIDLPPERVQVIQGDTDLIASGAGTGGSSSIPIGGVAVERAGKKLGPQDGSGPIHQPGTGGGTGVGRRQGRLRGGALALGQRLRHLLDAGDPGVGVGDRPLRGGPGAGRPRRAHPGHLHLRSLGQPRQRSG